MACSRIVDEFKIVNFIKIGFKNIKFFKFSPLSFLEKYTICAILGMFSPPEFIVTQGFVVPYTPLSSGGQSAGRVSYYITRENVDAARRMVVMVCYLFSLAFCILVLASPIDTPAKTATHWLHITALSATLAYCALTFLRLALYGIRMQHDTHPEVIRLQKTNAIAINLEALAIAVFSITSLCFTTSGMEPPYFFSIVPCFASLCAIISKIVAIRANNKVLSLERADMDPEEFRSRTKIARAYSGFGYFSICLGLTSICMGMTCLIGAPGIGDTPWNIAKVIVALGWVISCTSAFVLARMSECDRRHRRPLLECTVESVKEILEQKRLKELNSGSRRTLSLTSSSQNGDPTLGR
ncbi:MAG: hypothetical protein ACTJLL_02735 [Anaplasma sp.]